ncbi:MAG: hypothetical protein ABIB43_03045 [archaeon]
MALFGSKKQSKTDIPLNQVLSMREQGIDNNRIIQTLQRDGYSSSLIFEAMNQADLNSTGSQDEEQTQQQEDFEQPQEQMRQPTKPVRAKVSISQPSYKETSFRQPHGSIPDIPPYQEKSPEVEEMIETIIEEKWKDLSKDIGKIIDWKNQTEAQINSLTHEFSTLKDEFNKLHQAVIGKIGEYDKNILNVGAEIKAMEKVFSKVLPVFTEKVNDLSRITDNMNKKK